MSSMSAKASPGDTSGLQRLSIVIQKTRHASRSRAVRMVLEHGADHACPVGSDRLDCGEDWLHRGDVARLGASGGARPGAAGWSTSDDRERVKALEREVRELRQANEILRKASAYFAMAELDRRSKP